MIAVVNTDQCVGCGACAQGCPIGAISVDGKASVDAGTCNGCSFCLSYCPVSAISMQK